MRAPVPIVDLIIVGLTLAAGGWGHRHRVVTKALLLGGFGVGAFLALWAAPSILRRVLPDPYGPMLALPAALLCGGVLASALSRAEMRLRRRLRPRGRGRLEAVGGALLAGASGLLLAWLVAGLVGRVDALSASIGDSAIVDGLSAVLPSPGPLVSAEGADPEVPGTESRARSTSVNVTRDPQVRAAKASVVKIGVASCGSGRTGSGWIAADGIVVTAAHVVAQSQVISLQVQGKGQRHAAQAIWYDEMGDVAILRSSGLSGQPALAIEDRARPGARLAMLGFPGGGPYRARPARLGLSSTIGRVEKGNPHATRQGKRLIADARPGNSGGPVVDAKGHVVGVVFARTSQDAAYAVSSATVQHALRRAQGPVDTGACKDG